MEVANLPARVRGFTLVELLTTLAVAMALLSVGIPGWSYITQKNAVVTARDQMRSVLGMARLAAVRQRRDITVCPSLDLVSCSNDHTTWHQGLLLFQDDNGNRRRDPGEALLRATQLASRGITIHSSVGRKAIRYAEDGSAWGSNVTLRFCSDSDPQSNKAIVLYGTGRMRLSNTLANGSKVSC